MADAINHLQRLLGNFRVRVGWYFEGPLDDTEPLMVWNVDFLGKFLPEEWIATAEVPATNDTSILVFLKGLPLVSIFFAAGARIGVITPTGDMVCQTTDKLTIPPLVSPDPTLADVAITAVGKLTRL